MSARYLLPCGCGQQVVVEARQAGLEVACACGARLSVPSIRGLNELARVEGAPPQAKRTWGPRQGVLLLGALIAVPCLVLAVAGHLAPLPEHPSYTLDLDLNQEQVEVMPVDRLFEMWEEFNESFDTAENPELEVYRGIVARVRAWTWVYTAGAVLGVGLIAGSRLIRPQPAR